MAEQKTLYVYDALSVPSESKNGINKQSGLGVPFGKDIVISWDIAVEAATVLEPN